MEGFGRGEIHIAVATIQETGDRYAYKEITSNYEVLRMVNMHIQL